MRQQIIQMLFKSEHTVFTLRYLCCTRMYVHVRVLEVQFWYIIWPRVNFIVHSVNSDILITVYTSV